MKIACSVLCFLIPLAIGPAASAADAPGLKHCLRVNADAEKWTHPSIGPDRDKIWVLRADCRSLETPSRSYRPVSGGYRFEGIWGDASIAAKWLVVGSEPYVSRGTEVIDGWQCMVLSIEPGKPPVMPQPIQCAVTCCPD